MAPGIVVKVNNFGFNLVFTILNADGTPFDLTNLFMTLYVFTQEQFPVLLFSGTCTSAAPTTGICTYLVAAGNFSLIGTYNAEIEITDIAPPTPPTILLLDTDTFNINVMLGRPLP